MTTLDELFAVLDRARGELLAALAGLSDQQLDRSGVVGAWSVKQVLAHLDGWERLVLEMLPERLATRALPPRLYALFQDDDRTNAQFVAERASLTPQAQLDALEATRFDLRVYVASLDAATLARQNPWLGYDGTLVDYLAAALGDHELEHVADIQVARRTL